MGGSCHRRPTHLRGGGPLIFASHWTCEVKVSHTRDGLALFSPVLGDRLLCGTKVATGEVGMRAPRLSAGLGYGFPVSGVWFFSEKWIRTSSMSLILVKTQVDATGKSSQKVAKARSENPDASRRLSWTLQDELRQAEMGLGAGLWTRAPWKVSGTRDLLKQRPRGKKVWWGLGMVKTGFGQKVLEVYKLILFSCLLTSTFPRQKTKKALQSPNQTGC